MSTLVCGRCGKHTAPDSTYCVTDQWILSATRRLQDAHAAAALRALKMPHGIGMLARRNLEKRHSVLEKQLRETIARQLEDAENLSENEPNSASLQLRMGVLAWLGDFDERALAHLQRAHQLNPNDLPVHINYSLALVERGQLQPAMELLRSATARWPEAGIAYFNLMLASLESQRPESVRQCADAINQMAHAEFGDWNDDVAAARGFALLQEGKRKEAHALFEKAARLMTAPSERKAPAIEVIHDNAPIENEFAEYSATRAYQTTGQPQREILSGHDAEAVAGMDSQKDNWWDVLDGQENTEHLSTQNGSVGYEERATEEELAHANELAHEELRLPHGTDADTMNNLAIGEMALGNIERATDLWQAAMRTEPGNSTVYFNLGAAAFQNQRYEDALRYLEMSRDIEDYAHQKMADTHVQLGLALAAMGRLEESWKEFQAASGSVRADFDVWYNVARAAIEAGRPEKGIGFLRRAFNLRPSNPDVHALMGAAYLLRGKAELLDDTAKYLKRALQLDAHHFSAMFNLILTLMASRNFPAAETLLQHALQLFPQRDELVFVRALITLEGGNDVSVTRAATQFHMAYSMKKSQPAALYNLALCQYVMGMAKTAVEQLNEVIILDAEFAPAYFLQGYGYATAKNFDAALESWISALRYEPHNADLQANLGFLYYQRQDWQKSLEHYLAAHRHDPEDADILACVGLAYGRIAKSIKDVIEEEEVRRAKALIKSKPGPEDEHRKAEYAGMLARSLEAFQKSLGLFPSAPVTHSNLGLVYYFQNKVESAVEQWRVVSRLDARYAASREEDQYTNFDDTQMALRPLKWKDRVVTLAPMLPEPHVTYRAGNNMRDYLPLLEDETLKKLHEMKREYQKVAHTLGWVHAHR